MWTWLLDPLVWLLILWVLWVAVVYPSLYPF